MGVGIQWQHKTSELPSLTTPYLTQILESPSSSLNGAAVPLELRLDQERRGPPTRPAEVMTCAPTTSTLALTPWYDCAHKDLWSGKSLSSPSCWCFHLHGPRCCWF